MDILRELLCSAMTLIYATNPYTVQIIPKGECDYCCPINKGDIKLFMNIYEYGQELEFDWENGTDWMLLNNNRTNAIYIHGFTEQSSGPAASDVRQAYMSKGHENLIVVDWSPLAAAPWYHSAVANTHRVATWLAKVIDTLVIRGLPLSSIHVIGFSLGAEIAGLTAKKLTVGKLRRITGLDPALPLFHELDPKGRLTKTDADFVNVIHTDGGIFGFETPMGHADFFPNGGRPAQPGCRIETVVHTGRLNEFVACSHNRAWKFYAESVRNPYAFPAFKCHSFHSFEAGKCPQEGAQAYMGYLADPSLRGKFYLDTRSVQPYGLGRHEGQSYTYQIQDTLDYHHGYTDIHMDHKYFPLSLLESKSPFRESRGILEADEGTPVHENSSKVSRYSEDDRKEQRGFWTMHQEVLTNVSNSIGSDLNHLPFQYDNETYHHYKDPQLETARTTSTNAESIGSWEIAESDRRIKPNKESEQSEKRTRIRKHCRSIQKHPFLKSANLYEFGKNNVYKILSQAVKVMH